MTNQYLIYVLFGAIVLAVGTIGILYLYYRKKFLNLDLLRTQLIQELAKSEEGNSKKIARINHYKNVISELEIEIDRLNQSINNMKTTTQMEIEDIKLSHERRRVYLIKQIEKLITETVHLKQVALVFERWHQDMDSIMTQNCDMHATNQELSSIVKQIILISFNAAIEAAKAGEFGRAFAVVASEVKILAGRSEILSENYSNNLSKNDLTITATFQDIQAGGKIMMTALSGLEMSVNRLQSTLESTS